MTLVLNDRVKETTTTSGTNNFILGGAVSGFQTFATIGNGSQTYYACADQIGANWEVGVGTYVSSTNTLSRDTILSSSNGGAKVAFGTGTKDVFITYPAERALYADASNNISLSGTFSGAISGTGAFTTLSASSTVSGTGFSTYLAAPPAIGGTAPAAGSFTSVTDTGLTSGRVVLASTGGLLADNAALTFDGTTLSSTKFAGALNGTVGATTPNTGAFTSLSASSTITLSGGTANGVLYLNGSKQATSGSALTFDGTKLSIGGTSTYTSDILGAFGNTNGVTSFTFRNSNTGASATSIVEIEGFQAGNKSAAIQFGDANYYTGNITCDRTNGMTFGVGNTGSWMASTEQMRLTSTGLEVKQSQLIGYSSYAGIGTNGLAVAGNVGIGTSSPVAKLDVNGPGDGEIRIRAGSDASLIFSETTANKNWKIKGSAGDFFWQYSSTSYSSGYSALMTLSSSGNLGIGTSSPATRLQVGDATVSASNKITFGKTTATTEANLPTVYAGSLIATAVGNDLVLEASSTSGGVAIRTAGSTRAVIDSSGNLGIGTSSPSAKLDVNGDTRINGHVYGPAFINLTNGTSYFTDASTGNGIYVGGSTGTPANTVRVFTNSSEAMRLSSDGTFRVKGAGTAGSTDAVQFSGSAPANSLTLDSSGNLLVGTTSQISTTNGISILPSSAGGYVAIGHATGTPSGNYYSGFYYNGSPIGSIAQNGTTGVLYNITSDQRLKTDLGVATSTAVIDNTIIHDFEWKVDGSKSSGVFAQEAYKVKPEAVSIGNDELNEDGLPVQPWGVDYSKYVPDLIVYCQQLKAELNELKSQLGK